MPVSQKDVFSTNFLQKYELSSKKPLILKSVILLTAIKCKNWYSMLLSKTIMSDIK